MILETLLMNIHGSLHENMTSHMTSALKYCAVESYFKNPAAAACIDCVKRWMKHLLSKKKKAQKYLKRALIIDLFFFLEEQKKLCSNSLLIIDYFSNCR